MSGIICAAAAGIGFGLFQAFYRRANQLIDAAGATFVLLSIAVVAIGTGSALTQDLGVLGTAPRWAFLVFALAGIVQFFFGGHCSRSASSATAPAAPVSPSRRRR